MDVEKYVHFYFLALSAILPKLMGLAVKSYQKLQLENEVFDALA